MWYVGRIFRSKSLAVGLSAAMVIGCGQIKPSDDRSASKEASDAETSIVGGDVSMQVKADYDVHDATVLFLIENSDRITSGNAPFRSRLYMGTEHTLAFNNLVNRLRNMEVEIRFAAANAMFDNETQVNSEAGELKQVGPTPGTYWIDDTDKEFITKAGGIVNPTGVRYSASGYRPLTVLNRFADYLSTAGKTANGLHVKDRMLVVISVGYMDERNDGFDVDAVLAKLSNVAGGLDKVRVHVLGTPREGCKFTGNDSLEYHTNMDNSAAGSQDIAVYGIHSRVAKMVSMQEKTQGLFTSICDIENYVKWTDDIATKGILPGYFKVDLKEPVAPGTLKVSINGTTYKNWRLESDGKKFELYLGTDIKKGTSVDISYKSATDASKVVASGSEDVDKISEVKDDAENAALAAFNDGNFAQDFQSMGCQGCHQWANPANSIPRALSILDRVRRAAGATGAMPPDPAVPRVPQDFITRWTEFTQENLN